MVAVVSFLEFEWSDRNAKIFVVVLALMALFSLVGLWSIVRWISGW